MKTNAVRIVETSGVPFVLHTYSVDAGEIDAVSVARKLGIEAERLFKTLVARGDSAGIFVFCVPATTALDLKRAAAAVAAKNVELVRAVELRTLTGYERGGCSPIGMKRAFPVWIEESALAFDQILLSAGAIGLQIELSPRDLLRLTGARIGVLV